MKFVDTKQCSKCLETKDLGLFAKDKSIKSGTKSYCQLCAREYKNSWLNRNPLAEKGYKAKFYEANSSRVLEQQKDYIKKNREAVNRRKRSHTALYRASKSQRTPKWAEINEIKVFYSECPENYHVDHIIPLNGKNVSGLHVIGNLQYLASKDNLRKGNSFNGTGKHWTRKSGY